MDIVNVAHAAENSMVACSGSDCGVCSILETVSNVYNFLVGASSAVAILVLVLAGLVYIFTTGRKRYFQKAKLYARSGIIGFALVLAGWLVVRTLFFISGFENKGSWWRFQCGQNLSDSSVGTRHGAFLQNEYSNNLKTFPDFVSYLESGEKSAKISGHFDAPSFANQLENLKEGEKLTFYLPARYRNGSGLALQRDSAGTAENNHGGDGTEVQIPFLAGYKSSEGFQISNKDIVNYLTGTLNDVSNNGDISLLGSSGNALSPRDKSELIRQLTLSLARSIVSGSQNSGDIFSEANLPASLKYFMENGKFEKDADRVEAIKYLSDGLQKLREQSSNSKNDTGAGAANSTDDLFTEVVNEATDIALSKAGAVVVEKSGPDYTRDQIERMYPGQVQDDGQGNLKTPFGDFTLDEKTGMYKPSDDSPFHSSGNRAEVNSSGDRTDKTNSGDRAEDKSKSVQKNTNQNTNRNINQNKQQESRPGSHADDWNDLIDQNKDKKRPDEAEGTSLCDDDWSEGDGTRMAVLKALRRISKRDRLRYEMMFRFADEVGDKPGGGECTECGKIKVDHNAKIFDIAHFLIHEGTHSGQFCLDLMQPYIAEGVGTPENPGPGRGKIEAIACANQMGAIEKNKDHTKMDEFTKGGSGAVENLPKVTLGASSGQGGTGQIRGHLARYWTRVNPKGDLDTGMLSSMFQYMTMYPIKMSYQNYGDHHYGFCPADPDNQSGEPQYLMLRGPEEEVVKAIVTSKEKCKSSPPKDVLPPCRSGDNHEPLPQVEACKGAPKMKID